MIQINFFVSYIKKFRSRKDLLGQRTADSHCGKIRYSPLNAMEQQELHHYY